MLGGTLIEAASWRLAAPLTRRLFELVTKRGLAGDGQHAAQALSDGRICAVMLSGEATVEVLGRENGGEPQLGPTPWCDSVNRDETPRTLCRQGLLARRTGERVAA